MQSLAGMSAPAALARGTLLARPAGHARSPGEQPREGSRRARAGVHDDRGLAGVAGQAARLQLGGVCLPGCPGGSCYAGRVPAVPAGCRPLARTGEVPGAGVCAGCPERISVAGEVRRACIRPRPLSTSMTAPAMNAAIAAIPAIMPMVPEAWAASLALSGWAMDRAESWE